MFYNPRHKSIEHIIEEIRGHLADRTSPLYIGAQHSLEEENPEHFMDAVKTMADISYLIDGLETIADSDPFKAEKIKPVVCLFRDCFRIFSFKKPNKKDLENFIHNYKTALNFLDEAGSLRTEAPSICGLSGVIDEEGYSIITSALNVLTLSSEPMASHNKVFHVRDLSGNPLVVKITNNRRKASIESAANYFFSRHDKLSPFVVPGISEEPINYGGFYLTLQTEVKDTRRYDAYHYMVALAHLHAFGKEILDSNKIVVPEWEAKDFEAILEDIDSSENTRPWTSLKSRYEDLADKVRGLPRVLIHGDAKADNLRYGKILDLESLKLGDPSLDLALYLGTSGIPTDDWGSYVMAYALSFAKCSGSAPDHGFIADLLKRTKELAPLVLLKEYGGIALRRDRLSPIQNTDGCRLRNLLLAA